MGYFAQFNNEGVPFMDKAEKGELANICGERLHMDDFGIIRTKEYGKCAVMHFVEYPGLFFFGNAYVTEMLQAVLYDDMKDELAKQEIVFTKKVAKESGREYTSFKIIED